MKSHHASNARDAGDITSTAKFLAQPAYHADEDSLSAVLAERPSNDEITLQADGVLRRTGKLLRRFLFEKPASQYSSISPRTPNGSRTKIFPFNGSGKGR
jgi:hypothetical protein